MGAMRVCALIGLFCTILTWGMPVQAANEGRWWRGESEHFIVYGDLSQRQVVMSVEALEDFDFTLRALTGGVAGTAPSKFEVYLVRNRADLQLVSPRIGEDVAGFYRANLERSAAFLIDNNNQGFTRRELLQHEYAHHFMLQYFPYAYPRWYIEGWAEYVSTVEVRERRARVGVPSTRRTGEVLDYAWPPVEVFLAPERSDYRRDNFSEQFYALAGFAALYIANRPERMRGLDAYVRSLGEGQDAIAAFEPAFGVSPSEFYDELRAFRRDDVNLYVVHLPVATTSVQITRLPREFDNLLLPLARAEGNVADTDKESLANALENLAADSQGPTASLARARVAILRGRWPVARQLLEDALAGDEANAGARFLLARTIVNEALTSEPVAAGVALQEARRQLTRGFRQNPNHAPTLFLYAWIAAQNNQTPTESDLQVLARALELAPQVTSIRLFLARQLMRAGHFESAMAALRPIMYSPHGAESSEQARELFEVARRHELPPSDDGQAGDEQAAE